MFTHVVFNMSVTETRPSVSHCILITTEHEQANIFHGIKL